MRNGSPFFRVRLGRVDLHGDCACSICGRSERHDFTATHNPYDGFGDTALKNPSYFYSQKTGEISSAGLERRTEGLGQNAHG